jgi:PAS domain S-box-containing protein
LTLRFYARLWIALIVGYALVAVGICGAAIWYALQTRSERLAAATHSTVTLVRALDEHVRRSLSAVNVLLADVATEIASSGGVPRLTEARLHRDLSAMQVLLPQVRSLFIYSPDSILYAGSHLYPIRHFDGSAQEYVSVHRRSDTTSLYVARPFLSPVTGLWSIAVSRRIPLANGSGFGGVAGAIIDQEYFNAFYRDLGLTPSQGFALFRVDGTMIFRFPQTAELKPGIDVSDSPLFTEGVNREPNGIVRFVSKLDGVDRVIAYRYISDLSLVVALSHGVEEILAPWRRDMAAIGAGVVGALAALSVLLWIALRQIRRGVADAGRLREAEEQYRSLVEFAPIGIARQGHGVIEYANPEFARIFGVGMPEALVGRTTTDLAHPEEMDRVRAQLAALVATPGRTDPALYRVQRGDGSEVLVEGQAVSVRQGDRMLLQLVVRDVTAEQRAAEEVRRLNETLEEKVRSRTAELKAANEELESFSYSVSHDLRAPLRAIAGFSAMMRTEHAAALPQDAIGLLQRSESAAKRMSALIEDLLSLARVSRQDMHKARVDLSKLAGEIAAELADASPARRVEVQVAPELSTHADPALMRVALQNLLANAWKYTAKSTQPRVELGEELIGAERAFYVRDNGAGFDMQHAEQLFRPFQRLHSDREYEGTGIGLAIVDRIIRRHGGRIWANAQPGHGATFRFTLP